MLLYYIPKFFHVKIHREKIPGVYQKETMSSELFVVLVSTVFLELVRDLKRF